MRKSKKIFIGGLVGLAVLVLGLPATNLIVGLPTSQEVMALSMAHPSFDGAKAILATKCANCHTFDTGLPIYGKLPVARGLIEDDIARGRAALELGKAIPLTAGEKPGEVVLAKTEYVLQEDLMPPRRYLSMHWDGGLSDEEIAALTSWIQETRATNYAADADSGLSTSVLRPIPPAPEMIPEKVALGEFLYHDTRLSGDRTLSCASCHDLNKGGTDQAPVSTGIDGQKGPINSPTVYNAVFNLAQFWDGRAADLKEQAAGPVENPMEMGAKWDEVVAVLNQDEELKQQMLAQYPGGITKDTVTDAIAIYESTLVTPNSRFDQYLLGNDDVMTKAEKNGYHLFLASGCAMCHAGEAMGGLSYERMGRFKNYFLDRGNPADVDKGRFNVTNDEADLNAFKTPLLRNVAVTAPYFHDASAASLEEAVAVMAEYQVSKELSDVQITEVAAFLKTLTGEYKDHLNPQSAHLGS